MIFDLNSYYAMSRMPGANLLSVHSFQQRGITDFYSCCDKLFRRPSWPKGLNSALILSRHSNAPKHREEVCAPGSCQAICDYRESSRAPLSDCLLGRRGQIFTAVMMS